MLLQTIKTSNRISRHTAHAAKAFKMENRTISKIPYEEKNSLVVMLCNLCLDLSASQYLSNPTICKALTFSICSRFLSYKTSIYIFHSVLKRR